MHVKLEVETQPLSNLWFRLRRVLKITLVLGVIILGNAALGLGIYTLGMARHRNPESVQFLAIGLPVLILIFLAASYSIAKSEVAQEARWRNSD